MQTRYHVMRTDGSILSDGTRSLNAAIDDARNIRAEHVFNGGKPYDIFVRPKYTPIN